MRVLFVTHNIPRFDGDAAGSFVLRLAVALQSAGARVEVIAPWAAGLSATGTIEGVTITRVRYADDDAMTLAYEGTMVEQVRRSWSGRFALIGLLRALRRAARAMITNAANAGDPFDIVHAHWWFPAGLALWRALPRSTVRVLTMHGSDVRLAQSIFPARAVMKRVCAEYAVRTAVSSWLAATASRLAGGRSVEVAPMPVDTRHFTPDEHATRAGILFVGRLNSQKGIGDLLNALSQPALHSATLDIVGDGPDRATLEAQIAAAGLDSRVRWHSVKSQPQLVPLYQRASVVAMPSREEGLGLVAVEAQLCGTPVVAYASGGLLDVVRPEAGGTLVPTGDIDALATALASLLNDPARAQMYGDAARAEMRGRFSPESVATGYLALYRDAVAGARRS